ncbi:substrate-binding domain-containing protein [Arthrobacter sp. PAMC25564]|uniref:substrate-binding domain-containing protein n=1 Tax=Arthrobacter sp. PAMC25564 TaxID=2565366 RepID=UPI0014464DFD|nr:substrate-binding domain-containing protein [Arthrobacter sp. PAMC25564]
MALCSVALLGACAGPSHPDAVRGALIIVGSGTQEGAINAWRNAWVAANKSVSVSFSPDGQDVGLQALLAGNTYVATSDAPLSAADAAASTTVCGPDGAFTLPTSITPVAAAFNLGGIHGLKLDAPTLSAIFTGTIKSWNDPQIVALNPTANLPAKAIVPVTSKAPSALALTGSRYLSDNSAAVWPSKPSANWPATVTGTKVAKDSDIAKEVDDNFGTIAFLNVGDIGNRFNTVALEFNGKFFTPTTDPINMAIAGSAVASSSHGVSVDIAPNGGTGYQLASVSYQVFCSSYKVDAIATMVKSWAEFIVSEPGQTTAKIYAGTYPPSGTALEAAQSLAATIASPH